MAQLLKWMKATFNRDTETVEALDNLVNTMICRVKDPVAEMEKEIEEGLKEESEAAEGESER